MYCCCSADAAVCTAVVLYVQFLAHHMPEDDIHELREVFEAMDKDNR
jgi:hypothetical protein